MQCFVGKKELAELLKVSQTTINRLLIKGLPHIKVGGQVRFEFSEVLLWIKERGK